MIIIIIIIIIIIKIIITIIIIMSIIIIIIIIIQSIKYTNTANLEFSGISKRCETPKKYIFPVSFKSTTIVIRIS